MTDYHQSDRLDYAGSTFVERAHHNREESNRARQAAEALFAPKPPIIEQSARTADPTADQRPRKPRILSAAQPRPTHAEQPETPVTPVTPKLVESIPAAQLDRIRTWLKYGMTTAQVAEVYGVAVGDIERILHNA